MIPLTGFTNLDNKRMKFKWYSTSLQPYTHGFWARIAMELIGFPPTWGLAWYKMVRLEQKIIHDSHPRLHESSQYTKIDFEIVYITGLQPHTHMFWARTATTLVKFPSKWGLVLYKVARLDQKTFYYSPHWLHKP